MTDHKRIAVPYDPEQCVGTWGWLWEDDPEGDEGTWMLVATVEGDEDEPDLLTAVYDASLDSTKARGEWDAATLAGQPYIPCSAPACEPDAGLLVTIRMALVVGPGGGGGSLAYAHAADDDAEAVRERVIAALGLGQ